MWPLCQQATTRLPLGTEDVRTVPLFNQWTIWWNANRLSHALAGYWHAPIFFPDVNTFAYSEPQPLTMLAAPLVWWGSATLAYNIYLLASLLLNGWFTHLLLRWLGHGWLAAASGGIFIIALPIVHWQLGVVQLVPLWGILWTIWALAKLQALTTAGAQPSHIQPSLVQSKSAAYWHGTELGVALAVTSWMAIYHALFLTTLMIPAVLMIGTRLLQRHMLGGLALASGVCLLLTSPMIPPMLKLAANAEFVRPSDIIEKLSLVPGDYLAIFGETPLRSLYIQSDRYWCVSPGWLKMALALIGLCGGLYWPNKRAWAGLLLVMGLTAFVFSLGSNLRLGSVQLWEWMSTTIPGFKQVRSPFRYAYFVHIAIALGAAGGIQVLWSGTERLAKPRVRLVTQSMLALVALAALFDPLPGKLKVCVVPDLTAARDWCDALRSQHDLLPGAALCLPMAGGDTARDFEQTCVWMMYGTQHGVPLVNGYSGFCPQRVLDLGSETWEESLNADRLTHLYDQGVRYLIVHRGLYHLPWSAGQQVANLELPLVIASPSGIDVYQLKPK